MAHDQRLVKDEGKIEELRSTIPDWIERLERPKTPCLAPAFGPLEGVRAVGTGQLIAQPYIGAKLGEFGAWRTIKGSSKTKARLRNSAAPSRNESSVLNVQERHASRRRLVRWKVSAR